MISMMRPHDSWVARWNGISSRQQLDGENDLSDDEYGEGQKKRYKLAQSYLPGIYAVRVF